MAVSRRVGFACYVLVGLVSIFAFMASVFYLVGALGVFDDPPHTRIVDAIVFVVLIVVGDRAKRLAGRLGDQRRAG